MPNSSAAATIGTSELAPVTSLRWTMLAWSAFWLLGAYLVIVLPLDELFLPALNRPHVAVFAMLFSYVAGYQLIKRIHFRQPQVLSEARLKNSFVLCSSMLFCCLGIDLGYTVYSN